MYFCCPSQARETFAVKAESEELENKKEGRKCFPHEQLLKLRTNLWNGYAISACFSRVQINKNFKWIRTLQITVKHEGGET